MQVIFNIRKLPCGPNRSYIKARNAGKGKKGQMASNKTLHAKMKDHVGHL